MDTDLVRWGITIAVPALLAWFGKVVLNFLQHQQERADSSQLAFLSHLKDQAEHQMTGVNGVLVAMKQSIEHHTEASKENNRKLDALLQREETEIGLMQEIANELKEARRNR